jgi:hypothetical protein
MVEYGSVRILGYREVHPPIAIVVRKRATPLFPIHLHPAFLPGHGPKSTTTVTLED